MPETPDQKARSEIDADLTAAGWVVQDRDDLDLTAARGIAVREFPMKAGFGHADYLLYVDRKAAERPELHRRGGERRSGRPSIACEVLRTQLTVDLYRDYIQTDLHWRATQ